MFDLRKRCDHRITNTMIELKKKKRKKKKVQKVACSNVELGNTKNKLSKFTVSHSLSMALSGFSGQHKASR